MSAQSLPLVSVVTPVYNCEEHFAECIESILAQTYSNWEYTIVNNCSSDGTLEIAESYARKDSRIRIVTNEKHVWIIENHNIAFRTISPLAQFCKIVFADDWLFPRCIEEMVGVAQSHASVGVVGAYGFDGIKVLWEGLPYPSYCVPGHQVCREKLLGGPYFLGSATNLLFRADVVRQRPAFFNDDHLHADMTAFLDVLGSSDFGFVHQILSFCRRPERSTSTFAKDYNTFQLGSLHALLKFGSLYLTKEELNQRLRAETTKYYRFLAKSVLRMRDKEFWDYHRKELAKLGLSLNRPRLAGRTVLEIGETLLRPRDAWDGIRTWWLRAR